MPASRMWLAECPECPPARDDDTGALRRQQWTFELGDGPGLKAFAARHYSLQSHTVVVSLMGTIAGPPDRQLDGSTAIFDERIRQLEKGYTREHDAQHGPIEIIDAALAYVVQAQDRMSEAAGEGVGVDGPDAYWPWGMDSFKASDDELRSLAKAGALLAAAYDSAAAQRATAASE